MTDDWARPTGGGRRPAAPSGEIIEITLDGPADHGAPSGAADDLVLDASDRTPDPNWRKVVGIASILGVGLGVIVAAVLLGGDDEPVDPATTTLAPEEASALITTPPTLPPVDAVDDGFAGEAPAGPGDASVPTIPDYLPVVTDESSVPDFVLDLPVSPLDRPVVSTITISRLGETFGGPAVYDPVNERVRVSLGDGSVEQILLVDLASEDVLLSVSDVDAEDDGQRWQRMGDDLFGAAGRLGLREYIEALLLGPVRADNIGQATITTGGLALLDDATVARQRFVSLPVDAVPEWDLLYGIGGGDDAERSLQFESYVSEDGATYVTQGVNETGGEQIATVHRVRVGDGLAGPIDWPSDDLIDEFPAFDDTPTTAPPDVGLDELRPVYEDVLADPADFDLDTALDALRTATPAVMTVWERGQRGVSETQIRRDDTNDRLALTRRFVEGPEGTEPFSSYFAQIDDRSSGTGWLRRGEDESWVSAPLGNGIAPIDPRWGLGLVTADELAAAQRIGTGAFPVMLDNGVVVRPFTLLLPPDTLQWAEPLVGGVSTTAELHVTVFVGADGLVHEIHVVANQGLPRLFQQRFDHGRLAVTIELP